MVTRRSFVGASLAAALATTPLARADTASPFDSDAIAALEAIEQAHGGRLGVAVIGVTSGRWFGYRAGEHFPLCSTYKFLAAAAVLAQVDGGAISLDQPVRYTRADLLAYAPITAQHVERGVMTVGALCAAAVEWSDNTAANLLLGLLGGPSGWTSYARSLGDVVSRLDRTEPALNTAIPGDERDTTTPVAMVRNLQAVLYGRGLSRSSQAQLETWLLDGKVSDRLLRAGVPTGWRVGDKSGSGDHGTRNDIGVILRPAAGPILITVYHTESTEEPNLQDQVIADVGRVIAQAFAS